MIAKIRFVLPLALVTLLLSASAVTAKHTMDSLDTVKKRLKTKDAILIDVRESDEWNEGHLKAAQSVPLSQLNDAERQKKLIAKLPKKKIVYCHCRSGGRALRSASILKSLGFDIRPLKPGYGELLSAGFEKDGQE